MHSTQAVLCDCVACCMQGDDSTVAWLLSVGAAVNRTARGERDCDSVTRSATPPLVTAALWVLALLLTHALRFYSRFCGCARLPSGVWVFGRTGG